MKTLTTMQKAYGKSLLKKLKKSKREQVEKWDKETWRYPRYDQVFIEGTKWLDENG